MSIRVGFGYDVHRLSDGESLILGGVEIPHTKGTVAHSDGDVLIHAICDALLGAANLRDIGFHFPDNNNEYKNKESVFFLKETIKLVYEKGFVFGNLDATICLEKPKIIDYIPKMQVFVAQAIGVDKDMISIKATTEEKLGFVGQENGVAVHAVVLIIKKDCCK
jgi:2-C-methyl-D-erythritol 2,4-cyclodiphosphate synthase